MAAADIMRIGQMREAGIEQRIVSVVKSKGGLCLKWVSPGYTGVPDRIAILPGGRVVFKRVGDLLRTLGCTVIIADKLEDLNGYI